MGSKTLVILRIKPKNPEMLAETINELKQVKDGQLKDTKKELIGFGITIIKAGYLVDEKDTEAMNKLLEKINKLETVEEAEIEGMTLL